MHGQYSTFPAAGITALLATDSKLAYIQLGK